MRPGYICASRGPRIGSEDERPHCWRPLGHRGPHKPHPEQGWGALSWDDPAWPNLRLRQEAWEWGALPYRIRCKGGVA